MPRSGQLNRGWIDYQWNKLPSSFDLAKWTAEHTQLVRARQATLEAQGFTVYTEAQNAFKLTSETGIQVSGKPDREPPTVVPLVLDSYTVSGSLRCLLTSERWVIGR